MKIYFSPYFNGHTYADYKRRSLMGEVIESEGGLLSRLELMCGMAYPDEDGNTEKSRLAEYYNILSSSIKEHEPLYDSIHNDDAECSRFSVTAELLRWRDTLILAGWDKTRDLPGKLSVISNAERSLQADGPVSDGEADRWLRLKEKVSSIRGNIEVELRCPCVLVPKLIRDVIGQLSLSISNSAESGVSAVLKDCKVVCFNELYNAYEWLAQQPVLPGQVIVCNDGERLDNVLGCYARPLTSGDANTGCHHVITDVRSMLDTPDSLIWIDCNGGYRFIYDYDFITECERAAMPDSISIPDKGSMIMAVHNHYVEALNSVSAKSSMTNVTLVSSICDTGKALAQHPMVACALWAKDGRPDEVNPYINIREKTAPDRIHFDQKLHYEIGTKVDVGNPRMSYSALDTLIQTPFNHVLERELGLYEPYNEEDVMTVKGKVAHKVVELMVKGNGRQLDMNLFDEYFNKALEDKELIDSSLGKCILNLPENRFEKEDLEFNLRRSLQVLISIIFNNSLEIVGSEVSIPANAQDYVDEGTREKFSVDMPVFGKSVAYIDMILKKKGTSDYYIFDFKYSFSSIYADKLEENRSIQFAFYRKMFNLFYAKNGMMLKGIGYYLFPKCTLYVPHDTCEGLEGDSIQVINVDDSEVVDTLESMNIAFRYRKAQFDKGIIEEGEQMPVDSDYSAQEGIFPLKEESGKKSGPYSANHIVLKNQIR